MKKIYIVGIGPGDLCQMTNEAVSAIEESEAVVGYTKYIDLIKDLTANKKIYMLSSVCNGRYSCLPSMN